jgi:hypothetical protein
MAAEKTMKRILWIILVVTVRGVMAAELPANHPSVEDALKATGELSETNLNALPNSGAVVSTIHSNNYTYIELTQNNRRIWLAAPKVELEKGTVIRYGKGITMVDFYSNGLKREFPEIYFVDRVFVDK